MQKYITFLTLALMPNTPSNVVALFASDKRTIVSFMKSEPSLRDPPSRVGPAILLGLVGAVLGAIIGFIGVGALASLSCAVGDSSGECMEALLVVLTTPAGAVIGAIVGVVAGLRRPRAKRGPGEGSERVQSGPPVWREAPAWSWLGVIGGLATCYGVLSGWRIAIPLLVDDMGKESVLTPGPEALGALGGLAVLLGGTLRILRPAAPSPGVLFGVGTAAATVGLAWGRLDLLGVPDRLPWALLQGFWISLVGVGLSIGASEFDRRYRRVGASTPPEPSDTATRPSQVVGDERVQD